MGLVSRAYLTPDLLSHYRMKPLSSFFKPSSYTAPRVRNILLGILLCGLCLAFFGYLAEITKWFGYIFLYIPARLGMINQISASQVQTIDFSTSPTEIVFSKPEAYVVYTAHLDLLMMSDRILEEGFQPWLRIIHLDSGQEVNVESIQRGLMPYDTPFAKGRPIYFFKIPQAGRYQLLHPTYPGATVDLAQYEFRQYEAPSRQILLSEGLFILILIGTITYHYLSHVRSKKLAVQNQNRQRAEPLYNALRNKKKR